jgi:hypothetical protein
MELEPALKLSENPEFLQNQLITYIGNKRALLDFIGTGLSEVQARLGKKQLTCLDLFAGSGQLGIEALSRGAREAVFVDVSTNSIKLVHDNLKLCGFAGETVKEDAVSYLQHAARARRTIGEFDQAITDSVELALSFYLFGGASSQQALSRARMLKTAKTGSFLAKRHLTAEIKQAIIVAAKQYQLKSGYMADAWTVVKLKKGTKIYGLLPGQGAFYTTAKFASLVKRENISAKTASELLQIAKHPKYPYRNKVQEYVLKDDVYVAMSTIAANPSSGKGGMVQYFIPNFSKTLKNGDWHQILAE